MGPISSTGYVGCSTFCLNRKHISIQAPQEMQSPTSLGFSCSIEITYTGQTASHPPHETQ